MDTSFLHAPSDMRHIDSLTKAEKRSLVLHILYTYESHEYACSITEIIFDYGATYRIIIESEDPILNDIAGIINHTSLLDEEILPFLKNWKLERISVLVKLILRYALWEMMYKAGDHALVINEAIELAKGFAEEDSYKFINGLLDAWVKEKQGK